LPPRPLSRPCRGRWAVARWVLAGGSGLGVGLHELPDELGCRDLVGRGVAAPRPLLTAGPGVTAALDRVELDLGAGVAAGVLLQRDVGADLLVRPPAAAALFRPAPGRVGHRVLVTRVAYPPRGGAAVVGHARVRRAVEHDGGHRLAG